MKYYSEIESKFFLPVKNKKIINHDLDNSKLPKTFYEKYQIINDLISKIKKLFEKISFNSLINNPNKNLYNANCFSKEYYSRLLNKSQLVSDSLNENLTLLEVKESIQCWGNIYEYIYTIDSTLIDKDTFIPIMQLFTDALIDIDKFDGSLAKLYLPNKWLLTSRGFLYNMRATSHDGGIFRTRRYYIEKTNWFLNKTQPVLDSRTMFKKIDPFPEFGDTSIILKNGYVRFNVLDCLLHFSNYYQFNYNNYDPKIIMIATGMIELRCDLMEFLDKLELYTDDPKDNLRKSISITNNKYMDFLIRCCGVSKITSSPKKTIITSSLTAKNEFEEYLEKGFNICFVPPIIINREKRMVEELDMDSPIVSAYIKDKVISEDGLHKGKVYTNHLRY